MTGWPQREREAVIHPRGNAGMADRQMHRLFAFRLDAGMRQVTLLRNGNVIKRIVQILPTTDRRIQQRQPAPVSTTMRWRG